MFRLALAMIVAVTLCIDEAEAMIGNPGTLAGPTSTSTPTPIVMLPAAE
jgi:hypothetical protein